MSGMPYGYGKLNIDHSTFIIPPFIRPSGPGSSPAHLRAIFDPPSAPGRKFFGNPSEKLRNLFGNPSEISVDFRRNPLFAPVLPLRCPGFAAGMFLGIEVSRRVRRVGGRMTGERWIYQYHAYIPILLIRYLPSPYQHRIFSPFCWSWYGLGTDMVGGCGEEGGGFGGVIVVGVLATN